MAMKDLFELSSVLQGDDHEKDDLERKKALLISAIKHQEDRVLDDLFDSKVAVSRDFEDMLDVMDREVDKANCTLHQGTIFNEKLAALPLETFRNKCIAYAHAVDDFRRDIQVVKGKLSKMESELVDAQGIDLLSNAKQLTELNEKAGQSAAHVGQLEHEMKMMADEKLEMENSISRVSTNIKEIIARKAFVMQQFFAALKSLTELESQLQTEQKTMTDFSVEKEREKESWETVEAQTRCRFEALAQKRRDCEGLLNSLSTNEAEGRDAVLSSERDIEKAQDEFKHEDSLNKANKVHVAELEKDVNLHQNKIADKENHLQMLIRQRDANIQCSFLDKLQQLRTEIDCSQVLHQGIRDRIQEVRQQLSPNTSDSALSQALQLIDTTMGGKSLLLRELQTTNDCVHEFLENHRILEEQANFTIVQSNFLRSRLQDVVLREESSAIGVNEKILRLKTLLDQQSIDDQTMSSNFMDDEIFRLQKCVREKEQALKQLLIHRKQIESSRRLQEEEQRLKSINQEKSSRLLKLKIERINLHKEKINDIEDALMEEDELFQENVISAEKMLIARKEQLAATLEELLSLPREEHKTARHKIVHMRHDILSQPFLSVDQHVDTEGQRKEIQFVPHVEGRDKLLKRKLSTEEENQNKAAVAKIIKKPQAKMRAGLSISSWHPNK